MPTYMIVAFNRRIRYGLITARSIPIPIYTHFGLQEDVLTTHEMFDVIDDFMAEQDTFEENRNEEGSGVDPEFDVLFEEHNTELYPGCTWMSSLNFLAKMMHIKVINKWIDSSSDQLLELLELRSRKKIRFQLPTMKLRRS
ncbi:hypothetical protein L2E82_30609 [Cichorium intybus]|uniref:Uncharacterized protein n=1 Tax=Cichorium intybus TaxID=13427 RepID=A0ACB9D1J8_CICIN|nr:hypothetical protein L2E82_30609 [Cichorium intybus]